MQLDHVLIDFGNGDSWTIRDAVRGTQIFGGIGSGKSSGSGRMIAGKFLRNGFGGLVLCAKPDEVESWLSYSIDTDRWDDVVVMGKRNKYELWESFLEAEERYNELEEFRSRYSWNAGNDSRFNPLEYELSREGEGAGEILNLTNLFMAIYKMSNRLSGGGSGGGGANSRFWDSALKRLLNNIFLLLRLSGKGISVKNMKNIVINVPRQEEAYKLTNDQMSDEEISKWSKTNFCIGSILDAGGNIDEEDEDQVDEYWQVYNYFIREFPSLADETRMSIVESFLGIAEPFQHGILKKYFAGDLNLYPEDTHEGKIIILNFAVKEFLDSGIYAQGIYKLLWQQATERRDIKKFPTPVFLWVDEAQLFLSDYDQIFQTTARSSRACTVFISQNISNYYVAIGGKDPKAKADSLLGNLGTKIFHSNNDSVTNEWASKVIGHDFIPMISRSETRKRAALFADTENMSEKLEHLPQVLPKEFTYLRSGGDLVDYIVDGVIQITGKTWSDGCNFQFVEFSQIKPL